MAKGRLLEDTFEQLIELGQSTAKKSVKQVAQTLNPFSTQKQSGSTSNTEAGGGRESNLKKMVESKMKGPNSTPLDFDRLKNNFQDKEKATADMLRNRLFQMVKQGDERIVMENKQKEIEKKRREEWEKAESKKKRDEEKKMQSSDAPRGKSRKNIFSKKKAAEQQHAETKPATGKQ